MTSKWALSGLEAQFRVLGNLIQLAHDCASRQGGSSEMSRLVFQFVSSIAAVGHYPLWTGEWLVPEERTKIEYVLPNGYGDCNKGWISRAWNRL
ncbi:hypothetical protein F4808DRAFT_44874 [Astrocystis sublimbata]|nr:hypothetical protein F4808DRAFT_44874 [Astrocystis sublimbata]